MLNKKSADFRVLFVVALTVSVDYAVLLYLLQETWNFIRAFGQQTENLFCLYHDSDYETLLK